MGFNLKDYEPVEDRNRKFWADHPEGRILTELVFHDGTRCVFRCEVYTNREDARPAATGYAEEVVTTRGVNATSAMENCETSAEGRALARLGYAPKGARPSREEMEKATRREAGADHVAAALGRVRQACTANGWDPKKVAALFEQRYGNPLREETDQATIDAFRESLFALSDAELKAPATNGAAA